MGSLIMDGFDWPLRKISEPHESNDVLLDSSIDDASVATTGNQRLLEMVSLRITEYAQTSKMEKPLIAVELLKAWRGQSPPGRFLIIEEGTSLWKDVGDKKARAYISKCLKHSHKLSSKSLEHSCKNDNSNDNLIQHPQHHESSLSSSNHRHRLDWNGVANKLYEREGHVKRLQEALERSLSPNAPSELVLICGVSGSGKSELAKSMSQIEDQGGYFLFGKFDQFRHQTKTYSAFAAAFEQYCRLLRQRGAIEVEKVSKAIQNSVGPEVNLLVESIPCLREILPLQETSRDKEEIEEKKHEHVIEISQIASRHEKKAGKRKERLIIAFRRFVRAILDPKHPIVIVVDDIQWADENSLDLLNCLVSPELGNRRGLLVIGTCRGNEVSVNSPLSVHLRAIEAEGSLITNIEVFNLGVDTITKMIQEAGMLEEQSGMLAEVVHKQTRGNAFFTTQYLQNLEEEGLLKRESSDAEWDWNDDEMQLSARSTGYDGQFVRLLAKKMMQLPEEVQSVLKVAACIGSEIRETLLFHACSGVASSNVLLALSVAEERGVIHYNFHTGVGSFSHDKFQEAAFSLVPEREKARFQLQIGTTLRSRLGEEELDDNLLLVTSLMAQGRGCIENEDEREDLAVLCLAAARKAVKASAFSPASQYVQYGLTLLSQQHWHDQYELSLLLYSTGSELSYCNGDHDLVKEFTKEVIDNAKCLQDKINAYTSLILSLDALVQFEEATDICFDLLDQLGEKFPRKPNKLAFYIDFMKTRRVLRGKTIHDILNLPKMIDQRALTAMSIIHLLYPILLVNDFLLSPLPAFRLVRLTLHYGLSSMSSVGFAFYASVLVRLEKAEEGCLHGRLALQIMDRYPVKEFEARTLIATWGNVLTEMEPLRSCLTPFSKAHSGALSTGDLNSSTVSLFCTCMLRFFIGDPLPDVAAAIIHAKEICDDYKQEAVSIMLDPLLQACYNLMGRVDDPLVLRGEVIDEANFTRLLEGMAGNMVLFILSMKILLAFYMNELEYLAGTLLKEQRKRDLGVVIPYVAKYFYWIDGVVAAATGGFLSRRRAKRRLRKLLSSMEMCPENNTSKVFILKAELDVASGQIDKAAQKYEKAMHYAKRGKFLNEQAFACERLARMYFEYGSLKESAMYFQQAVKLYEKWGAMAKVNQLKDLLDDGNCRFQECRI